MLSDQILKRRYYRKTIYLFEDFRGYCPNEVTRRRSHVRQQVSHVLPPIAPTKHRMQRGIQIKVEQCLFAGSLIRSLNRSRQ